MKQPAKSIRFDLRGVFAGPSGTPIPTEAP